MKTLFNAIGWCHFTVNFWWGCDEVSPGCAFCYARHLALMWSKGKATWGKDGLRWLRVDAALAELRDYDAKARAKGVRWRIFINSMSDTFEDRRDLDAARAALFAIAPTLTNLDLLLLTKRPENVEKLAPDSWQNFGWPRNVWFGFTAENQDTYNKRRLIAMDVDLQFGPPVIFISAEPLLGPLNLRFDLWAPLQLTHLWVIVGGESGSQARPMHPAWARSLRDQCTAASVPFYLKQWGEWMPFIPVRAAQYPKNAEVKHVRIDGSPEAGEFTLNGVSFQSMVRVSKKKAGRLLDNTEHNGFPQAYEVRS